MTMSMREVYTLVEPSENASVLAPCRGETEEMGCAYTGTEPGHLVRDIRSRSQ